MSAPRALACVILACARLAAVPLAAQQGEARSVEGRVMRGEADEMIPVAGAWVVLHRVGRDRQGALDSTRTGAHGAFTIRYHAEGDSNAVYFLATTHDGLAYLSSPLRKPRESGADAEIDVYDTASTGIALQARGRHVIAFAPAGNGVREIIEVYEVENPTRRTLVPTAAGRPTWSAPLPPAATAVRAEQGDVSPDALTAADGRVQVLAPFAPGIKQVGFAYRVAANAFPLALPPSPDTAVLEVLVEGNGATAAGAGLRRTEDQTVDGHQLARFLSPNAPAGASAVITVPAAPAPRASFAVLGLVTLMLAMMAGALTFGLRRAA